MIRKFFAALFFSLLVCTAASAQNCGNYPNTLTNGTNADATQVMANFNTVLNCVNRTTTANSPAQITADQNDYNPSSVVCSAAGILLINSDAARNITGLAGPTLGCQMTLINTGSFAITLKNQSTLSAAGNRFAFSGDFTVNPNQSASLIYDPMISRWRPVGASSGGGTSSLTSSHYFVGNSSNVASDVAMSGDCVLANTGAIACDSFGAWTTFTPTMSCNAGSATFAGVSGRYKTFGKTVQMEVVWQLASLGTCANRLQFTLPVNSRNSIYILSAMDLSSGVFSGCQTDSTTQRGSCGLPITNGDYYAASGVYEAQ